MLEVVPGVYNFTGLQVGRAYLLKEQGTLALIDSGLVGAPEKIMGQMRAAGLDPSDIAHIILTHAHQDHVGGVEALRKVSGAAVWSSATERPYIEGQKTLPAADPDDVPWYWRPFIIRPKPLDTIPVNRTVGAGDTIPLLGGLEVIGTPGHTPGHISLWQPTRRILFAGDALTHLFGRLGRPFWPATPDMRAAEDSMRRLAELDPAVICFGHGEPLLDRAAERLRAFTRGL